MNDWVIRYSSHWKLTATRIKQLCSLVCIFNVYFRMSCMFCQFPRVMLSRSQGFIYALLMREGGWGVGGVLRVSLSRQVFPLWGHFPPTNIFPLPIKVLVFPFVTWNETSKLKKVIKIWTAKWVNSQENFLSACGAYFCKNLQFITTKTCRR